MKYIKTRVNKILLVVLLCLCLGCEKKSALPQSKAMNNELNDINIDAAHVVENNNFLITIKNLLIVLMRRFLFKFLKTIKTLFQI